MVRWNEAPELWDELLTLSMEHNQLGKDWTPSARLWELGDIFYGLSTARDWVIYPDGTEQLMNKKTVQQTFKLSEKRYYKALERQRIGRIKFGRSLDELQQLRGVLK